METWRLTLGTLALLGSFPRNIPPRGPANRRAFLFRIPPLARASGTLLAFVAHRMVTELISLGVESRVEIATVVRFGNVTDEILALVETRDCDIIVLATEPADWTKRLFSGSVNVIPTSVNIEDIRYELQEKSFVVTDGKWKMDVKEFGWG